MRSVSNFIKLLLVAVVLLLAPAVSAQDDTLLDDSVKIDVNNTGKSYVLIVNCHLDMISWNDNYEDAVIQYVTKNTSFEVYTEHIKTLNINSMHALKQRQDKLRLRYKKRPEAVVLIGPAAFQLFASTFDTMWKNVPMLFLGPKKKQLPLECTIQQKSIDFSDMEVVSAEQMQKQYNVTGIWTHFYVKETVDLMMRTIKNMKHLVWISDNRLGSIIARMQASEELTATYPNLTLEFINPKMMSTNGLLDRVASYDNHTGVLFHTWYVDGNTSEDYYISNNLYKIIGGFSSVPVFSLWDMNTAQGFIAGGHFVPLMEQSAVAVDLLKKILATQNARNIPFKTLDSAKDYLNYSTLSSYHLNNIDTPDGVTYFQKPESSWYTIRYYLLGAIIILAFIGTYVYYRFRLLTKSHEAQTREMKLQDEFGKEIALRNFKLALSLEVSTIQSWVLDLHTNTILLDDIKKIVENPRDTHAVIEISRDRMIAAVHKDDVVRIEAALKRLADGKTPFIREEMRLTLPNGDGSENWYSMQAVVYERDAVGKPVKLIGTYILITETKKVELELRQAKEKADESNRLKSAFLANMSHEIRTPLNAIVGFSGIIARSKDEDEKRELASIVEHNNDLLLSLVNNILDLSKIESGVTEFNNSSTNINKLLEELYEEYHVNTPRTVNMILEEEQADCFLITERTRLKQVLENFLSNALKFTKQGSIRLGYYPPKDGAIRFYVKDTGCGIPRDKLNSIFGRFVKLNNFEQGTGLGLSLCQVIAERMNAQIGVYSEDKKGSEFWIEIPYVESAIKEDSTLKNQNISEDRPIILVAEDNESNYKLIREMLYDKYKIIHAWDGQEAVNMFKEHNPILVLMDVRMPIKDGYTATSEIRNISAAVPIIAVSAYAFDNEVETLRKNGFTGYEPKPVNRDSLEKHIEALVDKIES